MENTYVFEIYYDKKFICNCLAHTKYEAVDRMYYKLALNYPLFDRKKLKAKKKNL